VVVVAEAEASGPPPDEPNITVIAVVPGLPTVIVAFATIPKEAVCPAFTVRLPMFTVAGIVVLLPDTVNDAVKLIVTELDDELL